MGFFKRLSDMFTSSGKQDDVSYWFTVQCNRCGEQIRARVDKRNDPSINYDENGKATYFCRKVIMGDQLCFQQIEVELTFDQNRNLIDRQIKGGKFVEQASPQAD